MTSYTNIRLKLVHETVSAFTDAGIAALVQEFDIEPLSVDEQLKYHKFNALVDSTKHYECTAVLQQDRKKGLPWSLRVLFLRSFGADFAGPCRNPLHCRASGRACETCPLLETLHQSCMRLCDSLEYADRVKSKLRGRIATVSPLRDATMTLIRSQRLLYAAHVASSS
jgi:hypothetical protein